MRQYLPMARRTPTASPWTSTNPAPVDSDDMRADGLPVLESFNDRSQAARRAKFLGWLVVPQCPMSGKHGVCHPSHLPAWRQKTNAKRRALAKISTAKGVPYGPCAYGF